MRRRKFLRSAPSASAVQQPNQVQRHVDEPAARIVASTPRGIIQRLIWVCVCVCVCVSSLQDRCCIMMICWSRVFDTELFTRWSWDIIFTDVCFHPPPPACVSSPLLCSHYLLSSPLCPGSVTCSAPVGRKETWGWNDYWLFSVGQEGGGRTGEDGERHLSQKDKWCIWENTP